MSQDFSNLILPRALHWRGVNPRTSAGWWPASCKRLNRERPEFSGRPSEGEPARVPHSKGGQQHPMLRQKSTASRWREATLLCAALVRHLWSAGSSAGLSSTTDTWMCWGQSSAG